jgi:hypothetical protein
MLIKVIPRLTNPKPKTNLIWMYFNIDSKKKNVLWHHVGLNLFL